MKKNLFVFPAFGVLLIFFFFLTTGCQHKNTSIFSDSAQKALSTFELPPGFKIELVAAEPLVADPVDMTIDEEVRMYPYMNIVRNNFLKLLLVSFALILGSSCKQKTDKQKKETDPWVSKLKLPTGFHADHLYGSGENDQGSWVAMTFDNKGRMMKCDRLEVCIA